MGGGHGVTAAHVGMIGGSAPNGGGIFSNSRDTEGVDAKAFKLNEFTRDACNVAAAVAIGISEAARIYLVKGCFFPASGRFGVRGG